MAYATAFMETLTIASVRVGGISNAVVGCSCLMLGDYVGCQFPYYTIKDRFYMYSIGSICYGIYFIVSFPMYYRCVVVFYMAGQQHQRVSQFCDPLNTGCQVG